MRKRMVERMVRHAARDHRMVFLTGDLGFNVVEPLQDALGPRYFNAGIAEANMVTVAASLAASGLHPWVYSIAPFATARCLEQLRNDVCYEARGVRVIGVGGGYSYGTLGPTHHALEDTSLMAVLPGMHIANPSSVAEVDALFTLLVNREVPTYWRLDRDRGPDTPCPSLSWSRPVARYREGEHMELVTAGSLLTEVLKAADKLAADGIEAGVITLPVLAPFPHEALADALGDRPALAVYEGFEGNPLEAGVLRTCALKGSPAGWVDAGRAFARSVGRTDHLRRRAGLDAASITVQARALLARS